MTAEAKPRLSWVDTGRGIAIVLVAVFHATNWLSATGLNIGYWREANEMVSTLRMPLFFALSGLFAAKWLTVTWRDLWGSKLALFVWVFLVWEVIGSFALQLGLAMQDRCCGVKDTIIGIVLSPIAPRFELWFIWALILFFVVMRVSRTVDFRIQLAIAGIVSALALSGWDSGNVGWTGVAKYYFFFLAGLYLRALILRIGSAKWPVVAASLIGWASLTVTIALTNSQQVVGVYFVNCLAGVLGGIALSRVLSGIWVLRHIGSRTLPIYLAHTPIILVACFVIAIDPLTDFLRPVELSLPVLVAVGAVALALMVHRVTAGGVLKYLFEPPDKLRMPHGEHRR